MSAGPVFAADGGRNGGFLLAVAGGGGGEMKSVMFKNVQWLIPC